MQPRQIHTRRTNKRRRRKKRQQVVVALFLLIILGIFALLSGVKNYFEQNGEKTPAPPYTIAIDAGHGGDDVGAVGVIQEIEMTERTAGYLLEYLQQDENFNPVLTKQPGENASLRQRIDIANKKKADLFISIHGNASSDVNVQGFEVFPTPPGREHHAESYLLGSIIASQIETSGAILRGEQGVRYLYFMENEENEENRMIQESSNEQVFEEESFAVVEKVNCPSVLIEQCFITSEEDVNRFASEEGCRIAALAYYKSICEFYNVSPVI